MSQRREQAAETGARITAVRQGTRCADSSWEKAARQLSRVGRGKGSSLGGEVSRASICHHRGDQPVAPVCCSGIGSRKGACEE